MDECKNILCYVEITDNDKLIDVGLLEDKLKLIGADVSEFVLCGNGEPEKHPDINKILKMLKKYKKPCTLKTAALDTEYLFTNIKKFPPVEVTLYGISVQAIQDPIKRKTTIDAMKLMHLLKDEDIPKTVELIIDAGNAYELPAMIEFSNIHKFSIRINLSQEEKSGRELSLGKKKYAFCQQTKHALRDIVKVVFMRYDDTRVITPRNVLAKWLEDVSWLQNWHCYNTPIMCITVDGMLACCNDYKHTFDANTLEDILKARRDACSSCVGCFWERNVGAST